MKEIIETSKLADNRVEGRRVYRTGVAARLSGLPVETLRVWERRYRLSNTERSSRGQRLYSDVQVRRLGFLKQLVDQGHQISALVSLADEQLQLMLGVTGIGVNRPAGPIRIALIGEQLAGQIDACVKNALLLDVRCRRAHLDEASSLSCDVRSEVLLIELPEIHPAALPLIAEAREKSGASAVVVLYRFCAMATIRKLRDQGCLVARMPHDLGKIVRLCQAALAGHPVALPKQHSEESTPCLFDDTALTVLASYKNDGNCACPRHLAEILRIVGRFGRDSAQCAFRDPDHTARHEEFGRAACQARAILESALDQLSRVESLLPARSK